MASTHVEVGAPSSGVRPLHLHVGSGGQNIRLASLGGKHFDPLSRRAGPRLVDFKVE